ncbi:dTDP-glucose 4,6-dehydratase [bacterium]|nr:dTDP-glucose 4,6-dehydratase [bacterium]
MHNVLVTGGAGFIGSNFIRHALRTDPGIRIINLDALTYAGSLENLKDLPDLGRYEFVFGSICDPDLVGDVIRHHMIDTVVHFAAESHVDRSIKSPELFIRTNVVGTSVLLDSVRRFWMEEKAIPPETARFHHISTDEVFGTLKPGENPWTESSPYAPNSPYAATKAASDHLVRAYGHTYGLPYSITNCSNNYGPHQFPEKLIPLAILNALEGRQIPVYGDGGQIRDWLYVEDHCEAIMTVLGKGFPGETYHIGGNNQPTNLTAVEKLCDILDRLRPDSPHVPHRRLISFVKDRPGHDRRYAMDSSKIRRKLGWAPRHSMDEGFVKTVTWYMEHPEWVEAIRNQASYRQWMEINYTRRETP